MFTMHSRFRRIALGATTLIVGAALWSSVGDCARAEAAQRARPAKASPSSASDRKVKELLKERLAVLREVEARAIASYEAGHTPLEQVQQARRAVLDAELALSESSKQRIAILEQLVAMSKDAEQVATRRSEMGVTSRGEALIARASRLEAEIKLEQEKARAAPRAK